MKIFGREPTVIIQALAGIIGLIATFNLQWLTPVQAAAIVVVLSAVSGILNAIVVRPIAPAAFTSFVAAVAALVVAYGVQGVTAERVGMVQAVVLAALTLIARGSVTPVYDKAAIAPAEGVVR